MTQQVVVFMIVGASAAFVLRRVWRAIASARSAKAGCASGCGCDASTTAPSAK